MCWLLCKHTCTKPMEGGPKSLKAGLKLDDEGRDGEGTEDPGREEVSCEKKCFFKNTLKKKQISNVKDNISF